MSARLAYVNILARDIDTLADFYGGVFGFAEIASHKSPIYRCLDANGAELGFNAPLARGLLNIEAPQPGRGAVATYITFEMDTLEELDSALKLAVSLGARVLKAPYDTYYNARQCVLEDPEGNVFRLNFRRGPRKPASEVESPPWIERT
ncbi:MAG: VOC family protein [Beijerinckiaceae bacterium]|nr:VOC family protein [Beijerinckiaceae bacterium]